MSSGATLFSCKALMGDPTALSVAEESRLKRQVDRSLTSTGVNAHRSDAARGNR